MWNYIKKIWYLFLQNLFNKTKIENTVEEDTIILHDLRNLLNEFRMQNSLVPYFYSNSLEDLAQERSNYNYLYSNLDDSVPYSLWYMRMRTKGKNYKRIVALSVRSSGTAADFFREIITNQKYRGAILNGYLNTVGIGKCEKYICVIIAD
jgi:uncharacterized protein YkwD